MCSPLKMSETFLLCFSITWWRYCSAASASSSGVNCSSQEALHQRFDVRDSELYRLEDLLLKHYNHHLRPVRSYRTATNVTLQIGVTAIQEVNEAYQTLRHTSWFYMRWTDQLLTWDPADFDGLDVIELSQDRIWTPKVYVSNSLTSTEEDIGRIVRVFYNGETIWSPVGTKETLCSLDITFYPFDTQKCDMVLNLWTAPETEVYLNVTTATADSSFFTENPEWQITDLTVEPRQEVYQGKRFSRFNCFFHLKRRRLFHTLTLVVPNVLLALLAGFVFLLPQECGEKMSFSMSLLLAFAVNLSVLVTAMPRSSLQVSLLMIYLTSLSVVTALSVVTTICLLKLYHKVDVAGPKVTAVIFFLRELCVLSNDVTNVKDKKDQTLDRQSDESWSAGKPHSTKRDDRFIPPMTENDESSKTPDELTEKISTDRHHKKRSKTITFKEAAVTLDYVFFRVFVFVIIAMTSALVLTLFLAQT